MSPRLSNTSGLPSASLKAPLRRGLNRYANSHGAVGLLDRVTYQQNLAVTLNGVAGPGVRFLAQLKSANESCAPWSVQLTTSTLENTRQSRMSKNFVAPRRARMQRQTRAVVHQGRGVGGRRWFDGGGWLTAFGGLG